MFVGLTKDWNSSRKEFCDRFFNAFRISRANQVDKRRGSEPETEGP